MALPFLSDDKKKSVADLIVAQRKPDEEEEQSEENHGALSAAQDLIDAIHSKDAKAVSEALAAHRELVDSPSFEESEE